MTEPRPVYFTASERETYIAAIVDRARSAARWLTALCGYAGQIEQGATALDSDSVIYATWTEIAALEQSAANLAFGIPVATEARP